MRRLFTIMMTLMAVAAAHAAFTATDAFTKAPAAVFPLLDRNTRLDMIDYFNSGSATASKNAMKGSSRLTALTPMSLTASLTGSSSCQLALLPFKGDSAIMVIETVLTPAPDSRITLYDRKWNALPKATFKMPAVDAWLTPAGRKDGGMVNVLVPFMLASAQYDTATQMLTLNNSLPQFMSPDVYSQVKDALLPTLSYKWNGSQFTPAK